MKSTQHLALLFAVSVASFCWQGNAIAQTSSTASSQEKTAYSLTIDNDVFFQTDRYYTDGFQIEWKRSGGPLSGFEGDFLSSLCSYLGCASKDYAQAKSIIAQAAYTPRDILIAQAQPLDHPWGGHLYFERAYDFVTPNQLQQTRITGQIGLLGHYSLADRVQKAAHKAFGSNPPNGWDNQIGNNLAVLASLEKRYAFGDVSEASGTRLRTAAYWNLTAGNVQTSAAVGINFALGKSLPLIASNDPVRRSSLDLAGAACLFDWLQCSLFGGVEARAVAFNVFLDGNFGRKDPNVDKKPIVIESSLGGRLIFTGTRGASNGPFYLQFKATHRTKEFNSTLPVYAHKWGSLTFGVDF